MRLLSPPPAGRRGQRGRREQRGRHRFFPFPLHFFEPEDAAIARLTNRANGRRRTAAEVLYAMAAFALSISVCSDPNHTWVGKHADTRARARQSPEDEL
jgi:hypothetical protein